MIPTRLCHRIPTLLVISGLLILTGLAEASDAWLGYGNLRHFEVVPVVEHGIGNPDFRLAGVRGSIDEADRVGVEVRIADEVEDWVSPWGGLHLDGDTWKGTLVNGGTATAQSLDLGITGGFLFHVLPGTWRADNDLGIVPFGRVAVGLQHGTFDRLPTSVGDADGDLAPFRTEAALGCELEWIIERRYVLGTGIGVSWFQSSHATAATTTAGGTAHVDATLTAVEPWARFSLGVRF